MKSFWGFNFELIRLLILGVLLAEIHAIDKKPPSPIELKEEFNFRVVPWCINGVDEPEFQRYPFNEFEQFLDRDFKFIKGNDAFTYKIELYKIHMDKQTLGNSEFLENTAHFRFRAERRRDYASSVITDFEETPLEGLIIQPVFAPLGVGLPTGTFLNPEDINCFDCQYPLGQVVGCKKKTWLNFMHPNVLVFHHRMKTTKVEKERRDYFCDDVTFKKFCDGISKVEVVDPSGVKVLQDAPECFSNGDCKGTECKRPEVIQYCVNIEDEPTTSPETLCKIDDDCNPPVVPPDPPKDVPDKCFTKNENPSTIPCTRPGIYQGRSSEVHGTFVWFTNPCHYTRRIRFLFMAVHNFQSGLFSILQSGEFALPDVQNKAQNNLHIPSPIFTGFRHRCEPQTPKNSVQPTLNKLAEQVVSAVDRDLNEFDFSLTYDSCIRRHGDDDKSAYCMYNASFDNSFHVAPSVANKAFFPPPRCFIGKNRMDNITWDHSVESDVAVCKSQCPMPITTTESTTEIPRVPFIKRSLHGGINFVTNFCIMPITIFIARFYKETFNLSTIKGGKPWYWMHLMGSGSSSVLMYIGYFHKNYVNDENPHVAFGNTYIIFLAIAYISSWTRHKNSKITAIAEIVHGASGYACFILALCCMHTAPDLSIYPIIFVYCSCFSLGLFYIGMTCHICILDKKFGMQPKRRHFPTVEARFEELPVPKSNARRLSLIIILFIVFPMTLGTLFF